MKQTNKITLEIPESEFVEFKGTYAWDISTNLSYWVGGGGDITTPLSNNWFLYGMIKVKTNGTAVWIPCYQPYS